MYYRCHSMFKYIELSYVKSEADSEGELRGSVEPYPTPPPNPHTHQLTQNSFSWKSLEKFDKMWIPHLS